MPPSKSELDAIAKAAEYDSNTYQSKTGRARPSDVDNAGVDSRVENKFEGAQVQYGDELSTNRGYNRRIPPEEGGDLDAKGR